MSYTKRNACPHCGRLLIPAAGPTSSKLLVVGEFPGKDEIIQGVPFVGKTGEVLQAELLKVGLILGEVRRTNLWQHSKAPVLNKDPKAKHKDGECDLDWHLDQMVKEFQGKAYVLLMGSDVTQALLGEKVSERYGLMVKVPGYSDIHFWVSPNPAVVFKSPIGEMRLSFERFAQDVKGVKKKK
jgi:uracil-DNA glycosylase family 4